MGFSDVVMNHQDAQLGISKSPEYYCTRFPPFPLQKS